MKKVILTVSVVVLVFMGTSVLTSCGENNNSESAEQHEHMDMDNMDMDMNDKDVVYACPMHHNITGKEGDKCSICGMDLTNTETASEHQGHSHHPSN